MFYLYLNLMEIEPKWSKFPLKIQISLNNLLKPLQQNPDPIKTKEKILKTAFLASISMQIKCTKQISIYLLFDKKTLQQFSLHDPFVLLSSSLSNISSKKSDNFQITEILGKSLESSNKKGKTATKNCSEMSTILNFLI